MTGFQPRPTPCPPRSVFSGRPTRWIRTGVAAAATILLAFAAPAEAQVTPFTDPAAFQAAVPGGSTVETVDFEAVPAGTVVPTGAVLEGITWTHSIAGGVIDLAVGSGLPTTSGSHFLGLDAANVQDRQIQHGDEIDLLLPGSRAFGMTIVSGDPLLADDVLLVTPQGSAGNALVPLGTTTDGGLIYFIGLVSDAPFQTLDIRYGDPANAVAFLYTVDDLLVTGDAFKADVVGTKEAAGEFQEGGTVIYTVVLTNLGPGLQLDNPEDEFVDTLPLELALVSASADSGAATADQATNTVTWNGEIPAGGMVTITIMATVQSGTQGETIANQGTIFYDADGMTSNKSQRLTDDPSTADPNDPTAFLVELPAAIPTLSPWSLCLLALGLMTLALRRLTR